MKWPDLQGRYGGALRLALPGIGLAALVAAVAFAYAPALQGDFTFDDFSGVVQRPDLARTDEVLAGVPRAIIGEGSRSVADLTFAFDLSRAGLAPEAFHETGIAIHLATVIVAFLLARTLLRRAGSAGKGPAFAVALLFGLHPLATESVAYIVQRQETLAALLSMSAVLLALRAEERWDRLGVAAYASGTIAFALALGAKSTAVVAPAAFLLAALAFPGPGQPAHRIRALALGAPWLVLAAVHMVGLMGFLGGHASAGFDMYHLQAGPYWLAQGRVLVTYLRMALWPAGQSIDHDFSLGTGADVTSIAALAAVAAGAGLALAGLVRSTRPSLRLASFGVLWFLLILLPTSTLPIRDVLVEHRVYLALFGVALAVTALGQGALAAVAAHGPLSPRATLATGAAVALLVACALGAATRARAALWGDVVELWGDACQKDPGEFRPHANYGQLLQLRGDAAGAAREYEIALRLDPNLALSVRQLTPNYAYALLDLGRVAEAAAILDRRLAWNSDDPGAVAARARVFLAEGRPTQAEALLREHFVAEPALLGALGAAVEAQGRLGEAEAAYLRAVRMDPTNAEYRADRARVLARLGRLPEACYSLLEARRAIESRDVARLANVAASIGCK